MTLQEKEEQEIDIPLAPAVPYGDAAAVPDTTDPSSAPTGSFANSMMTQSTTAAKPPTPRTVDVIAPSDLPEDFEFYVDDPTSPSVSLLVKVPTGGARATQRFAAIVLREVNRGSHNIPYGKWRDGLWDCCTLGCCHPQWCLTFWCSPCALGQVLTRFKLTVCSAPAAVGAGLTAFQILFAVQVVYVVVNTSLSMVTAQYEAEYDPDTDTYGDEPSWVDGIRLLNNLIWLILYIFMLVIVTLMRKYVRNKYQIPEKTCWCKEDGCCRGCEDFCCAFWCQTCTICQVARHTADYRNYQAGCCTEDGLASGSPPVA